MGTDRNDRLDHIVTSLLQQMQCFFAVTPEEFLLFIDSDGDYINTEEVPPLYESYVIGKYAFRINALLKKYAINVSAEPEYDRVHRRGLHVRYSPLDLQLVEWRVLLDKYKRAIGFATELAKKYNVEVAILETDEEYHSNETKQKMMDENVFFISNENERSLEKSVELTRFLLECLSVKTKSPLETANEKRFEKADETASRLSEVISKIKQEYQETHQGKEPPMSRIAEILSERHVESPNGSSKWFAQTVKRILERSETKTDRSSLKLD